MTEHLPEPLMDMINGTTSDQLPGRVELEPKRASNGQHAGKANRQDAHFDDQPEGNQDAHDRQPRIKRHAEARLIGGDLALTPHAHSDTDQAKQEKLERTRKLSDSLNI